MKLYVIRHGETDRNKVNRVLGRSDLPLNTTGKYQADLAGIKLAKTHFDAIFSSPMLRVNQTAQAILKYQHLPAPVIYDDRLIEMNFGIYEGRLRTDPEFQKAKRNFFRPLPGGESYMDVATRVYSFLDDLARKEGQYAWENVLIVTHGGIVRMIENYFHGMDNEEFATFFTKNCEVRTYEFSQIHRDDQKPMTNHQLAILHSEKPELSSERSSQDICYVSGLFPNGPQPK